MMTMNGFWTMTLGRVIVLATITAFTLACNDRLRQNHETIVHSVKSEVVHFCPDEDCEDEYCKKYDCSSDPADESLVSTSVDKELGKLTVTYKMKRQQEYTGIDVTLMACENVTEEICSPSHLPTPWWNITCKAHTTKFITLKWNNSTYKDGSQIQDCSKNITVTFDFIYTSCYYVKINRCSEFTEQRDDVISCPKFETTKKRKEYLVNKTIGYADTCKRSTDVDGGYIYLRILENLEDVPKASMTIEKVIGNTSVDLLFCQNTTINGRSEWNCTFFDNQIGNRCTIDRVKKDGVPTSEIERTCSLYNLADANYSYSVSYNDLRCQTGTVWTGSNYVKTTTRKYCRWYSSIFCPDMPEHKVVKTPVMHEYWTIINVTLYVFISLAIITILSLLIAKIYYKRKERTTGPDRNIYERVSYSSQGSSIVSIISEEQNILNHKEVKILLIYARDCEKFHNVMNKFSRVLNMYGFKVFDFWDDAQAKEVTFYNQESWLESKIEESDKIVLVASECAVELERRNLLGQGGEQYLSPRNFDRLFNYALRVLRKLMSLDSERESGKVFLVSIKDLSDEHDPCTFATFSPSHHCLPGQLALLLWDLKGMNRPCELAEPNESNEVLEFKEAVKLFTEYTMENPHYIRTILE